MTVIESGRFAGLRRMVARDPEEGHRVASSLELFFDLVFVVAVSLSSAQLHHAEAAQHVGSGVASYAMVFFAIWWAWMNFTWFASAFDVDDWLYRLLTVMQMGGVLVLAAGTGPAMEHGDFTIVTVGYVIMRLMMVGQWLRAAAASPDHRAAALGYATGIAIVQALWVVRLVLPAELGVISFLVLAIAELSVPAIAERGHPTPWHPGHIVDRYGAFTLIVLGESILASTVAVVDAIERAEHTGPLLVIAACGLTLAAGMWWIYFAHEHERRLTSMRRALGFGYGHYLLFGAAGAFSAGIEVAIDADTHTTGLASASAAATLTVPVALFVVVAWLLLLRHHLPGWASIVVVTLGLAVGMSAFAPHSLPVASVMVAVIVVVVEIASPHR